MLGALAVDDLDYDADLKSGFAQQLRHSSSNVFNGTKAFLLCQGALVGYG